MCCSSPVEIAVHIGRDCPFTIALISSCSDLLQVISSSCCLAYPSFDTRLLHCSEELNAASFGVLLFLLWSVWKERNSRLWHDKDFEVAALSCQASAQLHAFRFVSQKPPQTRITCPKVIWKPPPIGWVKANMDGAFDQSSHNGGIGILFCDSSGTILGDMLKFISHVISPEHVETWAGREACVLSLQNALVPTIFETDSSTLVSATRSIVSHMSIL